MIRRRRQGSKSPRSQHDDPDHATRQGHEQERRILAALADVRDMEVREVMTPRVDVVALPIPVRAADLARAVRESGHSCFPVYDDDLDHLVGVLYVNDLFRAGWEIDGRDHPDNADNADDADDADDGQELAAKPSTLDISRRLRQPHLVPESRLVLDVLAEMRRDRRGFAVVVDEYGGVAGVITVKNLLAALVGDLFDEFDPASEPDVIRVDRNRWLVDGGASVDDVRDQIGLTLPEGGYVTLGGYLFDALGHIPVDGERHDYAGWTFRVQEMDKRRVAKVVVQRPDEPTAEASEPGE